MKRAISVAALLVVLACKKEETVVGATIAEAPVESAKVASLAPEPQRVARMIIRNATLSLVVRDAVDVLRKASVLVEGRGGHVGEMRQWKEREQVRAAATLRVPSAELSSVLEALRGLAVRVESENASAQDVSQEYSDLGAQIRNLQATEKELRELLRTVRERTQKAAEIMEIFGEITKVRGEIERLQGRVQYLSQVTALSTITLDLIPDVLAAPVVEPGWQPMVTVNAATRALINSMKAFVSAMIWVVLYLLPLGLVFAAMVLISRATWLRIQRTRSQAAV